MAAEGAGPLSRDRERAMGLQPIEDGKNAVTVQYRFQSKSRSSCIVDGKRMGCRGRRGGDVEELAATR